MTTQHPTQPDKPQPKTWVQGEPVTYGQMFREANPTPPKPKPFYKRAWFIVTLALAGAGLLGLIVLGALLSAVADSVDEAVSPAQNSIKSNPPAAAPSTVDVAPTENWYTPRVSDFKLRVIETGREKYGSIGDNVEFELELVKVTSRNYDPDKEYKLKYQVTGDENGPMTDTIVVRGDSYEQPYEDIASTRPGVKLSAKILSIREA